MGTAAGSRVLLVYPASESDRMGVLPLSLLYVAQPLLEDGIEVEVVDQRYERTFFETLEAELGKGPVCVGISCITGSGITQVARIARFVRARSRAAIVIGGPHATLLPLQTLRSGLFDYLVSGEGEAPFLVLVRSLAAGGGAEGVAQVGYLQDGEAVFNAGKMPDSRTRRVPYRLILKYGRPTVAPVVTSFGCPHNCTFCVEKVFHPRYREAPFEDVMTALTDALALHPDLVNFLDDNFLASRRMMPELLAACEREGRRFPWICTGRIDDVLDMGRVVLSFARERGLTGIFFGVESGSQRMLGLANKRITPEMVLEANELLRQAGVKAHYSFMAGFPTETRQDFMMTVRLIEMLKRQNPESVIWKINTYTPYPGTPMYELAMKNGFTPPETFEGWSGVHFYAGDPGLPYDNRY